jgi:hypothetical protein
VEKRVDFSAGQRAIPYRFVFKTFLGSENIDVFADLPYSPDLASCDFFLFPKVKSFLKGSILCW